MPKQVSKQTITVKSDEKNPEPIEIIARAIIDISAAYKKLENSRVKKRVIVLLLKDMTQGVGITDIEIILDAVPKLESYFLKQLPKEGK